MVGAIDKRDILAHPIVTIRCFGWRVFLRALLSGRGKTFLSVLAESEMLQPAADEVADYVARCVELELQASRMYTALARRFADETAVHEFFLTLAGQEVDHAELLEVCRVAATLERWDDNQVDPWRAVVPRLEQHLRAAEVSLDDVHSLRSALELVIDIESSEINDVFSSVVAATDSGFVRGLRVFRQTETQHLDYICRSISHLDPELTRSSDVLRKHCA